MTPKEKEALRIKMDQQLDQLEGEIKELKELTQPISPSDAIGRVSRMDAINNKSVNEAALHTTQENLKKLRHAISRIDEPDFGLCARCNNPIPMGRIMLMPQSNMCVNCASR